MVSGPETAENCSQATLPGASTVMSGWFRSMPCCWQAARKVEKVSYSLKSDSSLGGSCRGPISSQYRSGPCIVASVSATLAIMGADIREPWPAREPTTSAEEPANPRESIGDRNLWAKGSTCGEI